MFRSSTIIRELVLSLAIVMLEHLCPYRLCGGVAACLGSVLCVLCVLCAVQNETIGYVVVWQHVLGVACVLCAVQNENFKHFQV
jgi:membrane-bound ClpP family serine protease